MRDIPAPVLPTDEFIAGIPLLDENFDENDDFIEGHITPWQDANLSVPTTLKVRGYL